MTGLGRAVALVTLFASIASPAFAKAAGASRYPSVRERAAYVVEINAKGQVAHVRGRTLSPDVAFNTMTYGNALQVFVRTVDGKAIAGTYRIAYEYRPQTHAVRRSVALLHAGGVDPRAPGEVERMAAVAGRRTAPTTTTTTSAPLPDFESITHAH